MIEWLEAVWLLMSNHTFINVCDQIFKNEEAMNFIVLTIYSVFFME